MKTPYQAGPSKRGRGMPSKPAMGGGSVTMGGGSQPPLLRGPSNYGISQWAAASPAGSSMNTSGIIHGVGGKLGPGPQQQAPMKVVASVPSELVDSIAKTGLELERVVTHLARQEEELKSLREAHQEAGKNLEKIGDKMKEDMSSGMQTLEGGIAGKTMEDLKQMEGRLKNDIKTVIHTQMGEDAKRLELSLNERLGSSVERTVGNELGKALRNKAIVVAIGRVIAEGVAQEVSAGCKSEFTMSIVPTFKQSTTNLFTQLNQVFQKGIKDYIDQLEKQASSVIGSSQQNRRTLQEMTKETREMAQLHLQQMSSNMQNQLEHQLDAVSKRLHESINVTIRTTVKTELAKVSSTISSVTAAGGGGNGAGGGGNVALSGLAGGAGGGGAGMDRQYQQRQLAMMVQHKDINGAFQMALNACDLELLSYLLGKIEPRALFSKQPLPLNQAVLLSLLHQLAAADLKRDTDVKLKYIEETLTALDETSVEVQSHLPKIMTELRGRIKEFKETSGNLPATIARTLKKIEVTCQSFGQ